MLKSDSDETKGSLRAQNDENSCHILWWLKNISARGGQYSPPLIPDISNKSLRHLKHLPVVFNHFFQGQTLLCLANCLFPPQKIYSNTIYYMKSVSSAMLLSRHVVHASCCVWLLPAPHPSVGCYRLSLSTNQRGPKVRLATCHFGYVHQQVRWPVTPFFHFFFISEILKSISFNEIHEVKRLKLI